MKRHPIRMLAWLLIVGIPLSGAPAWSEDRWVQVPDKNKSTKTVPVIPWGEREEGPQTAEPPQIKTDTMEGKVEPIDVTHTTPTRVLDGLGPDIYVRSKIEYIQTWTIPPPQNDPVNNNSRNGYLFYPGQSAEGRPECDPGDLELPLVANTTNAFREGFLSSGAYMLNSAGRIHDATLPPYWDPPSDPNLTIHGVSEVLWLKVCLRTARLFRASEPPPPPQYRVR